MAILEKMYEPKINSRADRSLTPYGSIRYGSFRGYRAGV
jgi:hypothetical protein